VPDAHSLLIFIGAGLLLNITPGPDVLYIVGRSLSQGRTAGVVSSFGIAAGCLFHVTAAALGLSAVMVTVPAAFDIVRYAGAAYLVWLGINALRSTSDTVAFKTLERSSNAAIFRQGALTNILNPKVALFFLAFLPQFTDPARGPMALQILWLGLIFIFNGTIVCVAYALAAAYLGDWLKSRRHASRRLSQLTGVLYIALGLRLAWLSRR
jgi:threonine/homoserine/homoserine lactone efflux protein